MHFVRRVYVRARLHSPLCFLLGIFSVFLVAPRISLFLTYSHFYLTCLYAVCRMPVPAVASIARSQQENLNLCICTILYMQSPIRTIFAIVRIRIDT